MVGKESAKQKLHFFNKLKSLPNVNTHLNKLMHKYHCIKHSSTVARLSLWVCERYLKLVVSIGALLLLILPDAITKSSPVAFSDEFLCHQLEFLEQKLSPKTGSVFKSDNSIEARSLKALILLVRVLFVWPRLTLMVLASVWGVCRAELDEDFKMLVEIFSSTKSETRRTTARIKCKRSTSSPYQRKRKHVEEEGKVEQYLFVNESYQSENDPDYEIGETTCEDNATVDGENTEDELNNDADCFLCTECKDMENDNESVEEAMSSDENDCESAEDGEDNELVDDNGDSGDGTAESRSALKQIEEISTKFENQANERKSPIYQRG